VRPPHLHGYLRVRIGQEALWARDDARSFAQVQEAAQPLILVNSVATREVYADIGAQSSLGKVAARVAPIAAYASISTLFTVVAVEGSDTP
jgi:hypothetical protein